MEDDGDLSMGVGPNLPFLQIHKQESEDRETGKWSCGLIMGGDMEIWLQRGANREHSLAVTDSNREKKA